MTRQVTFMSNFRDHLISLNCFHHNERKLFLLNHLFYPHYFHFTYENQALLSFVLIVIKMISRVLLTNSFSWISNLFYSIFFYSISFIFNILMTAGTMWYPDMKYWLGYLILLQYDKYYKSRRALWPLSPCYYANLDPRSVSLPTYAAAHRIDTFANPWDRSSAWLRRQSSSAKLARSALSYSRRYAFPRGIYTCELRLLHAGAAKGLTTRDRDTYAWEKHRRTALMDE